MEGGGWHWGKPLVVSKFLDWTQVLYPLCSMKSFCRPSGGTDHSRVVGLYIGLCWSGCLQMSGLDNQLSHCAEVCAFSQIFLAGRVRLPQCHWMMVWCILGRASELIERGWCVRGGPLSSRSLRYKWSFTWGYTPINGQKSMGKGM